MSPTVTYVKPFLMDSGEKPDFELGIVYEITSAFDDDGNTIISVLNSKGNVHIFDITEDWFSESFTILGDIQVVWEEV